MIRAQEPFSRVHRKPKCDTHGAFNAFSPAFPAPAPLFALCEVCDSYRRLLFDGFLLSFIGVDEQALVWKVLVGRG